MRNKYLEKISKNELREIEDKLLLCSADRYQSPNEEKIRKIVESFFPGHMDAPLSRCLLFYIIENLLARDDCQKTFGEIIEILNYILEKINNLENLDGVKLNIFDDLFKFQNGSDKENIGDEAWTRFLVVKQCDVKLIKYAIAYMIYDLIPYRNLTFDAFLIEMEDLSLYDITRSLEQKAKLEKDKVYENNAKIRRVVEYILSPSRRDVAEKSLLYLSILYTMDDWDKIDFNITLGDIRNTLMLMCNLDNPIVKVENGTDDMIKMLNYHINIVNESKSIKNYLISIIDAVMQCNCQTCTLETLDKIAKNDKKECRFCF